MAKKLPKRKYPPTSASAVTRMPHRNDAASNAISVPTASPPSPASRYEVVPNDVANPSRPMTVSTVSTATSIHTRAENRVILPPSAVPSAGRRVPRSSPQASR